MKEYLGEGLSVLLLCSHRTHHDWMSFLCWYSFQRNLPECRFSIVCSRLEIRCTLFAWTKRAGVPLAMTRQSEQGEMVKVGWGRGMCSTPLLVVTPDILCVRDFCGSDFPLTKNARKQGFVFVSDQASETPEDDALWQSAGSDTACSFVSYSEGWGNFRTNSWIDKVGNPLSLHRPVTPGEGANEGKIAEVWRGASGVFHELSRS